MKKFIAIFVLCFAALSFGAFAQIKVASNGYVGINQASPAYNLDWYGTGRFLSSYGSIIFDNSGFGGVATIRPLDDWNGTLGRSDKRFNMLYADHVIARDLEETSDETMKENIQTLNNSLEKIKKLRGIRYDLKKEYLKTNDPKSMAQFEEERKNEIGFLAQELKEVFPEIVFLDTTSNLYAVNYARLVPVLVEAIKDQQAQIEELKNSIEFIEQNCCNNNLKSASISTDVSPTLANNTASLDQNIPNPFSTETKINCFVPDQSGTAILYVYNMQGAQLQQHQISRSGKQTVIIKGNSLSPGIYLYTLVIDGREIDTKRMILTK
ncbi:MAG: tail fiber domain-containing protein [Prolixibacteraceae bacterium]|jgi:hypothetical protein|nr:tail fiber domain-containing protein [Prolixibacteraceae bacterium]